jgi:tetratricopeptide (TPR) repeat protein/TolB-like protein
VLFGAGAWLTSRPPPLAPGVMRTLLVMPLAGPPGDAGDAQRYFVDGLTEALIAGVGETGLDRVISRTSAMTLERERETPGAIARELQIDGILDGTVDRVGDRVRLSVRLSKAANGSQVWSTVQERPATEVQALVAGIAAAVAGAMNHSMSEDATRRLSAVRAVRPDVYEAYLKGRYEWNRRTEPSLRRAIDYYQSAIRMDPTYAPAEAALADCYNQLGTVMVGTGSPSQFRPLAAAAAMKALQIDGSLSEAHATLGYIRHYEWRWLDSEREFTQAIRLNPSNALAHVWYANLLASLRRIPEALREVDRGRELDPFSLVVSTNVGWTLSYAGRLDEAIAQYRKVLAIEPAYAQAHMRLGGALEQAGRYEEALAEFEETARLTGNGLPSRTAIAGACASMGRRADAGVLLDAILRDAGRRYVSPSSIAEVYEKLGQVDAAFEWMERAYAERSNHIAYLAVESHRAMRGDPRYAALMHRVGLE